MINPLLALIEGHIAERQAARSSSVSDDARERALAVFVASARSGHAVTLRRLADIREQHPQLADRIDALIAAEPDDKGNVIPLSAEDVAAERDLGEAQRVAAGGVIGEAEVSGPPAPNTHPRPPPEAGGGIPEQLDDASLPAPSAWAIAMYGEAMARDQLRAARGPDESPAEFVERLRRYRQAGKAAERFAETLRKPDPDDATKWMGW
jgi:hypothetical protein